MHPGITIALLTLLAASPASAAMFKWTDANGNIQYGQYPPAGVEATRIETRPAPPAQPQQTTSPQQRLQQLEEQQAKQAEEQARAEAVQRQAEQKAENCRRARANLETFEMGGRSRMKLPDGTYLSGDDKQEYVSHIRQQIKEYCD